MGNKNETGSSRRRNDSDDYNRNYNNKSKALVKYQAPKKEEKEEELTEREVYIIGNILSKAIAIQFGFQFCDSDTKDKINRKLAYTTPNGYTAMRDAVVLGILRMVKLKEAFEKINCLDHKFIHIVLTDGEDTSSEIDERSFLGFFHLLDNALGDNVKTFFIGVELAEEALIALLATKLVGGDSIELMPCKDMDITNVFERISVEMGVIKRSLLITDGQTMVGLERAQLALQVKKNNFLVLFTLDISGSMSGGRWRRTKSAVSAFLNKLEDEDLCGVTLFNGDATMITEA